MNAIITSPDADTRDFIQYVLHRAGLTVRVMPSLRAAAEQWLDQPADLVLAVARETHEFENEVNALRAFSPAPLVILLETANTQDICPLLAAGADLVLELPVHPKTLAAYCHALLRRSGSVPPFTLPTLDLGEIALNPSTRTVCLGGTDSHRLTQLEFRLLYSLMTHRGQVIPTEVIINRVWGYSEAGSRELVRGLVSRLRAKIEDEPSKPRFIHTVLGVGYLFEIEP